MEKYKLENGFYFGIHENIGSGYIDFYDNNLFVLSSRGILAYTKNLNDEIILKQIKNNICYENKPKLLNLEEMVKFVKENYRVLPLHQINLIL